VGNNVNVGVTTFESGIAFGEKRNKVLAMNNRVEESVAKATMTADSEL